MSLAEKNVQFSTGEARALIHDLFQRRPLVYWTDLILTLALGYGCAMVYLRSPALSVTQLAALTVASLALFRAGSFIHEITHLRGGEMQGFQVGWNLLCGIPMVMPTSFYANHIDHHRSDHYGTIRDGEYLPLGAGPLHQIAAFWAQVPVLPIYVSLRLLLTPITFVHPKLRNWALEHTSSFVINFRHRLTIPKSAPRKAWAALELACCARLIGMLAVIPLGFYPWTRLVQLYCLAVCVLGLNYIRNMTAHHYRNTGERMTHAEQLEDSVNITGHWFWTELFFPLGLRYHALHHLFPALPYHNLGIAHRRLMARLPADSPYRATVYPSYWSVIRELYNDSQRATAQRRAAAAA